MTCGEETIPASICGEVPIVDWVCGKGEVKDLWEWY
jgi:hypothetical protein